MILVVNALITFSIYQTKELIPVVIGHRFLLILSALRLSQQNHIYNRRKLSLICKKALITGEMEDGGPRAGLPPV